MKSLYTIVGMQYQDAIDFVNSLRDGEPLRFKRDRNNEFDPHAVTVHARDRMIGFVRASQVLALANRMDGDPTYEARLNGDPPIAKLIFCAGWPHAEVIEP